MTLRELRAELRRLLKQSGVTGYRYAALVVHGRDDGPDEVIVVTGRAKVHASAPARLTPPSRRRGVRTRR